MNPMSLLHCKKCNNVIYEPQHLKCVVSVDREGFKAELQNLTPNNYKALYPEIRNKVLPHKDRDILSWGYLSHKPLSFYDYSQRNNWLKEFCSWCLPPSLEVVEKMNSFINRGTVLEIGAGTGLYSFILQRLGNQVIATDSCSAFIEPSDFELKSVYSGAPTNFGYCNVEKLTGSEAIECYGPNSDVLLIVWGTGSYPTMKDLNNFKGNKVIVVGENGTPLTSGGVFDELFDDLSFNDRNDQSCEDRDGALRETGTKISDEWEIHDTFPVESWYGIGDQIDFITRK